MTLADVNKRAFAHALDFFLCLLVVMDFLMPLTFGQEWGKWVIAISVELSEQKTISPPDNMWIIYAMILYIFAYPVLFWRFLAATPVQYFMKMRVINQKTNGVLGLSSCVTRSLFLYGFSLILTIVPILGFFAALLLIHSTRKHQQRRAFHDMFAGSLVVKNSTSNHQRQPADQMQPTAKKTSKREF